jgi:hypothetical protein
MQNNMPRGIVQEFSSEKKDAGENFMKKEDARRKAATT